MLLISFQVVYFICTFCHPCAAATTKCPHLGSIIDIYLHLYKSLNGQTATNLPILNCGTEKKKYFKVEWIIKIVDLFVVCSSLTLIPL